LLFKSPKRQTRMNLFANTNCCHDSNTFKFLWSIDRKPFIPFIRCHWEWILFLNFSLIYCGSVIIVSILINWWSLECSASCTLFQCTSYNLLLLWRLLYLFLLLIRYNLSLALLSDLLYLRRLLRLLLLLLNWRLIIRWISCWTSKIISYSWLHSYYTRCLEISALH